jgi:hypothetical protein
MAQPFRGHVNARGNLTPVDGGRRRKRSRTTSLMRRILTTIAALLLLLIVLKFLPAVSKHSGVEASRSPVQAFAADLRLSDVQISRPPDGTALYLDGLVTNTGSGKVNSATADVGFHDAHGSLVANVQRPLVGMSHDGTELVHDEFRRNPIKPNEMRFFRVAVEEIPPTWNHELPDLTIVEVTAK